MGSLCHPAPLQDNGPDGHRKFGALKADQGTWEPSLPFTKLLTVSYLLIGLASHLPGPGQFIHT